jgi:hypothetical protein
MGQEILGFADFKEGPLALVQESALLREQRWYPVRVLLIKAPGKSQKFF